MRSWKPPESRSRRCGTRASVTARGSTIPPATASSSTEGTHRMAHADALAAYEQLPLPDTTEEHWRFTDLKGFDPASFGTGRGQAQPGAVGTMLDLDVNGLATITEAGVTIERTP